MIKKAITFVLMMLIVTGCAKGTPTAIPTATPLAGAAPGTFPTLPPSTPVSAASATPFTSFTVKPAVDTLKVRMNPGYMFDALILVNKTDVLTVLGSSPGHEWTYIKTADGIEGWVFTLLLESSVYLTTVSLRDSKDVEVINQQSNSSTGNIYGRRFSCSTTPSTWFS